MIGHISDRTLDNLLDGSIDDAGELAIEEHVRRCDRCAHRLREWELLFPQIRSLIPTGEHPATPQPALAQAPRGLNVFVPDWTPPRTPHALPTKLAWGLVVLLALGAGYLLLQRERSDAPTVAFLPESYDAAAESDAADSGLGSGIASPIDQPSVPVETLPPAQGDTAGLTAAPPEPVVQQKVVPQREERPEPPPPVTRASQEQDLRVPSPGREAPVTFPIKVNPAAKAVNRQTASPRPPVDSGVLAPLPAQFQRVTLGEAIARLSGTVRLIQGLTPEAVEVAQGSALPGADPSKAVVRVVYNAPEGRLILDQQRVARGGSQEANIAISTAANGVSVAQWVDRGGFWISLAGRANQQTLLAIANRVR
jgi:anti-sigma factor RsiW